MGLLGMQERVHLVGGDMKIDSGPGQGTRIRVHLPLGLHNKYAERRTKRRIN
jgi:glucose-6-phosphate-specific signal transduction histidine kinase